MLNKSISLSKQVNKLSLKHRLIFTWAIPHLDDYGLIDNDPEVLKATICPMAKEITVGDFEEFIKASQIPDDNGEMLVREFKDCLEFIGFYNHQSISEEKRSKSKFSKIPRISQEFLGENNNPQNFPVQVKLREVNITKDKLSEDNTPAQLAEDFFSGGKTYTELLDLFSKESNRSFIENEFKKFNLYWTEPNKSGTRLLWQTKPTFEVKRRIYTWLSRAEDKGGAKITNKFSTTTV